MLSPIKKHSRGIGLLELMLSLLVIVIIVFTATRYFEVTNENLRVAEAENQINNIVQASYKWVQGQPDFAKVSLAALIQAQLLPNSYNINPWKGTFTIVASPANSQKIFLTATNIPYKSCINLQEKMQQYDPNAQCSSASLKTQQADFTGTF